MHREEKKKEKKKKKKRALRHALGVRRSRRDTLGSIRGLSSPRGLLGREGYPVLASPPNPVRVLPERSRGGDP